MTARVLVIGVGNLYRSDDAVGLYAAWQIAAWHLPNVDVIEVSGEGAALIDSWQNADKVILIDAVHAEPGAMPGTIFRFDARAESLPTHFFHYSTHAFSVAEAVELARTLNQLPQHLMVFGIEGNSFEAGTRLSAQVEQAARTVVAEILSLLVSKNGLEMNGAVSPRAKWRGKIQPIGGGGSSKSAVI